MNSHELRVGDVLHGRDGTTRIVLRIEQEFRSGFPVVNLTIEENHSFAVGADAVLVHNTGGCGSPAPNSGLTGSTRLDADELATGQRLEQLLGKQLKESPHIGAEYADDLGVSYDALGRIAASLNWNAKKFFKAIDGHLLKSNDFTVIDLTGFTPSQIAEVRNYLNGLSKAQLDKIIRIGF